MVGTFVEFSGGLYFFCTQAVLPEIPASIFTLEIPLIIIKGVDFQMIFFNTKHTIQLS